jgi:glycogen(starch) synthase
LQDGVLSVPVFTPFGAQSTNPFRETGKLAAFWFTAKKAKSALTRILRAHYAEIVHVHYPTANIIPALLAARRLRLPLITHFHGEDVERDANASRFGRALCKMALAKSDAVVFNSRYLMSRAAELCETGKNWQVIGNGVNLDEIDSATPIPDQPYILSVARFVEKKGLDVLLRAFALISESHPNLRLKIAGDGPEGPHLRQLANLLQIAERVVFLGRQDPKSVYALLRSATITAVPSRREPFGIVALEAMACGSPVVASAVGGLQDLVVNGATGLLFPPGDPLELSRALTDLLNDEALRQTISENARQHVSVNHTWAQVAAKHLALYNALGGRHYGGA